MNSLQTTIAANIGGLSVAPLAETITREASAARQAGADIIIVAAHAGGRCQNQADDAPNCDLGGELAAVAAALEPGMVDHIFGGHVDNEMAEVINGISVSMNRGKAQSFGRVDFLIDRASGKVIERRMFPPQGNPPQRPASYEGRPLVDAAGITSIAEQAAALAAELANEPIGIELAAAFPMTPDMDSALFNLVTEALLDSFDVDVAMHNVRGGLRAGLPAGPLTFSDIYEMFPFDNFATALHIHGADLRRVIAWQARQNRRVGFAGMRVFVACTGSSMSVRMVRPDGTEIQDQDDIVVLVNDYLAMGGDDVLTPIIPPDGFTLRYDLPRTRDALVDWLRARGGTLDPANWRSHGEPKWNPSEKVPADCELPG